jgi:hypothetical protein
MLKRRDADVPHADGAPVVVRDGESPLHGEGEQLKRFAEQTT